MRNSRKKLTTLLNGKLKSWFILVCFLVYLYSDSFLRTNCGLIEKIVQHPR